MPVSSDSKGADEDRTKIVPFASGAEQYRGKKYLKLKTCKWRIFSCQRAGVDLLQTWKQNNPYFSSFLFSMTILLLIFTCMFVLMIANYYKLTSTSGAIILRDLIPLFVIIFLLSSIVLKLASKITFHIVSHCG